MNNSAIPDGSSKNDSKYFQFMATDGFLLTGIKYLPLS